MDYIPGKNGGRLRRIPKGTSGNPKGRPRKLPELDKLLADVLGEEKDGVTAAEAILRSLRAKAVRGDLRAAEILLNRGYGMPRQSVDHTNKGEAFPAPVITLHAQPERETE